MDMGELLVGVSSTTPSYKKFAFFKTHRLRDRLLDRTTPQVNGTLSGTPGLNNYYVTPVTVSASASDLASGIASLEYSVNGGAWTAYTSPFVLSDGIYSLTLRATDWAGHVSVTAPQTVQVDATTPILNASISGTPGSNGWYVSQVTVSASASDPGSSLASFEVNVDGGGYVPYSAPVIFTDGTHTIQFKAVDIAGNLTETTAQTINVDTTTPTLTLDVAGTLGTNGWYTSAVVITPNASDPYPSGTMSTGSGQVGSGLDTLRGSQDGGPPGDLNSPLAFNADGIHSYQIIVCDKAGLCTDTAAQQIRIDTVRPILTLPALWILGNSAAYSAEDPTSGLAQATVRIQGQQYQDNLSGNSATAGLYWNGILSNGRPAPEGEYDMIVKVVDAAGNEVTGYTKVGVEPLAALLRPFVRIPPLGNPLPTPTPISPSVLAPIMPLTFGGQAQNLPIDPPANSTSLGGVTNPFDGVTSSAGFGVVSTTSSPLSSTQTSNILWGAAAAAAVGAFVAEWQRKREEAAARAAAEEAARREADRAERIANLEDKHPAPLSYGERAKAYQRALDNFKADLIASGVDPVKAQALKSQAIVNGSITSVLGKAEEAKEQAKAEKEAEQAKQEAYAAFKEGEWDTSAADAWAANQAASHPNRAMDAKVARMEEEEGRQIAAKRAEKIAIVQTELPVTGISKVLAEPVPVIVPPPPILSFIHQKLDDVKQWVNTNVIQPVKETVKKTVANVQETLKETKEWIDTNVARPAKIIVNKVATKVYDIVTTVNNMARKTYEAAKQRIKLDLEATRETSTVVSAAVVNYWNTFPETMKKRF
ncbi:MAG: hypothetical protein FJZ87_17545, partial [Chloroflexi bacterium]|nr:hypothetical protein [Chloroflexota bacterium]